MEFNEEKAKEIIERFKLSPNTLKVWRTRGAIPDRYNNADYDNSQRLKDNDSEYQKLIAILSLPEIASTKFRSLGLKGADIKRGKDRMSEKERIGFITEVTELRNLLRRCLDVPKQENFLALFKDSRLHPTIIYGRSFYNKVKEARTPLLPSEKEDAKLLSSRIYNLLRI